MDRRQQRVGPIGVGGEGRRPRSGSRAAAPIVGIDDLLVGRQRQIAEAGLGVGRAANLKRRVGGEDAAVGGRQDHNPQRPGEALCGAGDSGAGAVEVARRQPVGGIGVLYRGSGRYVAPEFGLGENGGVPRRVLVIGLRRGRRTFVALRAQVVVLAPASIDVTVAGEARYEVRQHGARCGCVYVALPGIGDDARVPEAVRRAQVDFVGAFKTERQRVAPGGESRARLRQRRRLPGDGRRIFEVLGVQEADLDRRDAAHSRIGDGTELIAGQRAVIDDHLVEQAVPALAERHRVVKVGGQRQRAGECLLRHTVDVESHGGFVLTRFDHRRYVRPLPGVKGHLGRIEGVDAVSLEAQSLAVERQPEAIGAGGGVGGKDILQADGGIGPDPRHHGQIVGQVAEARAGCEGDGVIAIEAGGLPVVARHAGRTGGVCAVAHEARAGGVGEGRAGFL